jgi:uncharacterized protein (DUF1015 family)
MKIKPFAALRPVPARAAAVAAVPYDVVDTAEARVLAAGNPDSFLHVSRPEIDLPDSMDIYHDAVYAQGVKTFQALQAAGAVPVACEVLPETATIDLVDAARRIDKHQNVSHGAPQRCQAA